MQPKSAFALSLSHIVKEVRTIEIYSKIAIAFQERIRISPDKMEYYKDLAEMYVGDNAQEPTHDQAIASRYSRPCFAKD
jgi:hypothetical protein